MYLSKLQIENFRGIKNLTIKFSPDLNIIIGENGSCKSAVIDAIRLLYNIGEPLRDISVTLDDFYETYIEEDEFVFRKDFIKIVYEFKGLSARQKGAFYEYLVLGEDDESSDKARIEIRYEDVGKDYPKFSFTTGGIEGQKADYNTFSLFQHYYLSALRDSTRDLMSTKNNILGKVIKRRVDRKETEDKIKDIIRDTNKQLIKRDEVKDTKESINKNLEGIFGANVKNQIGVQIQQKRIEYILNVIKPFLLFDNKNNTDEGFQLSHNSLGFNNLIYIATVLGDIKERIEDDSIPHFALLIEEPEAHLHPQLQLSLYNFLKKANSSVNSQLIVTTHSPTLTSKVPFKNLILLDDLAYTIGNSFINREREEITVNKSKKIVASDEIVLQKKAMLERYMDVTKSQLFFAKGCLFVEGISEKLLIFAFCETLDIKLEDFRIELIDIGGTSFSPFLFLFNSSKNKKRLPQKVTVLTDDDRFTDSKGKEYSFKKLLENDYLILDELYNGINDGKPCKRIKNLISIKNSQKNICIKEAYKTLEYEICLANVCEDREEIENNFLFKYIEVINYKNIELIRDYVQNKLDDKLSKEDRKKVALLLWKSLPAKASFAQKFANHIISNIKIAKSSFKVPFYIESGLNHLTK